MNSGVTYNALWPRSFLDTLEAAENATYLTFLGGAGFALKTPEALVWIDPFFGPSPSERALRMIANPVDPRFIRRADAVLSSHDHTDHCEQATLLPLAKNTKARLIGPKSSVRKMAEFGIERSAETVAPGDTLQLAKDLQVTVCPCHDPTEPHAVSYLFKLNGKIVYFGADGFYADFLTTLGGEEGIDVAVLNYGHTLYMDAAEVLRCASALDARTVIPMHWDIWKDFRADPADLVAAARVSAPHLSVEVLTLGDRYPLGDRHA